MKELLIVVDRFKECEKSTISKIYLYEGFDKTKELFNCYGLEPLKEGLESGKNLRIPADEYKGEIYKSPRFKRDVIVLHNDKVKKDRYIEFHIGNYPKDTIGCILVGKTYKDDYVGSSKDAFEKIMDFATNAKEIKILINNDFKA